MQAVACSKPPTLETYNDSFDILLALMLSTCGKKGLVKTAIQTPRMHPWGHMKLAKKQTCPYCDINQKKSNQKLDNFLLKTTRLAASLEGLSSSPAQPAGEL